MSPDHDTRGAADAALYEAASDWFVRRRDAGWTAQDEAAFRAWCDGDPRRPAAFDRVAATWLDFDAVPRPSGVAAAPAPAIRPGAARARPDAARPPPQIHAARVQGAWLYGCAAVLLCAALASVAWYPGDRTAGYTLEVSTAAGERRSLQLPDGSRIELDVGSRLHLRHDAHRRVAVLDSGEAFFDVAPDRARPFSVDSGGSRVVVTGTRFNLRAAPPRLQVEVQEGRVRVTPDRDAPERVIELGAAQGLAVDAGSGSPVVLAVAADSIGEWRQGRRVFRRTPIAEVAQELSRYLGVPVRVEGGPSLHSLTVSSFVDLHAPAAFLEALPDLLPVRVTHRPGDGYRITAR